MRPGEGQHEINLVYAEALEMADRNTIYKNGAKEIADLNGRSLTFMAKYDDGRRRLVVPHPLERCGTAGADRVADVGRRRRRTTSARCSATGSAVSLHASRELSLLFAPYVNSYKRFQPDSWAPTAIAWGLDNRTCGLRLVGHGDGLPGGVPDPRRRRQLRTSPSPAIIAAGLHGIAHQHRPRRAVRRQRVRGPDIARIPSTLVEAIDRVRAAARWRGEAFGADVHHHLLNTARRSGRRSIGRSRTGSSRRNFERI